MSYIIKEVKKEVSPNIREVLRKYNVRATIASRPNNTLEINLRSGSLDIMGNIQEVIEDVNQEQPEKAKHKVPEKFVNVNPMWYHHHFRGKVKRFFDELIDATKGEDPWYDNMETTDNYEKPYNFKILVGREERPYRFYG